jgi:SAM-dependent methyltransferase
VSPLPTAEQIDQLYVEDYYEEFLATAGITGGNETVAPYLVQRLDAIESYIGKGRLVDLGCAMGHFVGHAASRGWDAVGIEKSQWATEAARELYGITVYQGELADAPLKPHSIDVVHANHVVEHLTDPAETFRLVHNLLRPGGLFVIEVPAEFRPALADRVFARLHPEVAAPPEVTYHVYFFTERSLITVARQAGFQQVRTSHVRHGENTDSRLPLGSLAKRALYGAERLLGDGPGIEMYAHADQRDQ